MSERITPLSPRIVLPFANIPFPSVESQGRTLEELEWVYQQPNPVKASQNVDKIVVQSDGTVTEKIEADA